MIFKGLQVILLFFFMFLFSSFKVSDLARQIMDQQYKCHNLKHFGLKGKVAKAISITNNYIFHFDRNGNLLRTEFVDSLNGITKQYQYNESERLISRVDQNVSGKLAHKEKRKYNQDGNLTYEYQSSIYEKVIKRHFYHRENNTEEIYVSNINGKVGGKQVVHYNKKGQPVLINYYYARRLLPKRKEYAYTSDTSYSERHFLNNELKRNCFYVRDINGKVIEKTLIKGYSYECSNKYSSNVLGTVDTMIGYDYPSGNLKVKEITEYSDYDIIGNPKSKTVSKIYYKSGEDTISKPYIYKEEFAYEYYE